MFQQKHFILTKHCYHLQRISPALIITIKIVNVLVFELNHTHTYTYIVHSLKHC